ncbi:MAG: RNA polymerase sigma factor [Lentimicrobium sp.]|nr:RNA polymerase sigma factor [Lentimicrobium sp.]
MTSIEFHSQLINLESSLFKFACRLAKKRPDAEDLVQDTFLKVLLNQGKYIEKVSFKAWTFTILKNTFIDRYRYDVNKAVYSDQTNEQFFMNKTTAFGSDEPDVIYSAMEIDRSIDRLQEKFRIPFRMYLNGYNYKEIADELNLNLGTVKSRIFLSRKHLMVNINS